jgi:hypothetical protein
MSRFFWLQLVDSGSGQPFMGSSADAVSLPDGSFVFQFRDAAKAKNSNKLSSVDSSDLVVYKNKAAFDKRNDGERKEDPLEEDSLMDGLGMSKKEALIVVVPSSGMSLSTSASSLSRKEPHTERLRRWILLNHVLRGNPKRSILNDSTAYSYVTWNQVKSIFNPTKFIQPRKPMDDAQLEFLSKYLSFATACLGSIGGDKEAKHLHFIAPVLICVCILLNGEVDIVVEEDLTGDFVKAHGHFEFMLRRGNKAVCIVEAKKEDFDQGMAQDLVGCEVAAEVGGLDIVYGIVTNYIQWNFLRSLNDKVEFEVCSLDLTPEGPERKSLQKITEKIYAMLSNE